MPTDAVAPLLNIMLMTFVQSSKSKFKCFGQLFINHSAWTKAATCCKPRAGQKQDSQLPHS